MADIDLIFKGADGSDTEEHQLQVFCNTQNRITISVKDDSGNSYGYPTVIQLSKATAIKFHRELKKQISFIDENL